MTATTSDSPQPSLRYILELVFWAGQHNQYPDQNREPGTSVDQAEQAIEQLLASAKLEQLTAAQYAAILKQLGGKE